MEWISIAPENLEGEHICCAISNNKDPQVRAKKAWLAERLKEGLVFLKADERGKCFIEYIPAEFAWVPVEAEGYMHVNCFWVSGRLAGHGYANQLLDACIRDSREKGKRGLCAISSPRKMPFLSDPGFLAHRGFQVVDEAEPHFTLMALPFAGGEPAPRFKPSAKRPRIAEEGFVLYYTHGCPFTAKYVPLVEQAAKAAGLPFRSVLIDSREKAQAAPAAWTNYALFYNGEYVTHEILNEKKLLALANSLIKP